MPNYISIRGSLDKVLIRDGFKVGLDKSCDFVCGENGKMAGHHFTLLEDDDKVVSLKVLSTFVDSDNVTAVRTHISNGIHGEIRRVNCGEIMKVENDDEIIAGGMKFLVHLAVQPPLVLPVHLLSRDTESEDVEPEANEEMEIVNPPNALADTEKEELEEEDDEEEVEEKMKEEEMEEHVSASLEDAYELPQSQFAENAPANVEHVQQQQLLELQHTQNDDPLAGGTQVAPLDEGEYVVGMVDVDGAFEAAVAQVQDDIMTGGIKTSEQEEEIAIKEDFDDFHSFANESVPNKAMTMIEKSPVAHDLSTTLPAIGPVIATSLIEVDPVIESNIMPQPHEVVIDVSGSLVTPDIALQVKAAMELALAASASTAITTKSELALPSSSSSSSSEHILPHVESPSARSKRALPKKEEKSIMTLADSNVLVTLAAPITSHSQRGDKDDTETPPSLPTATKDEEDKIKRLDISPSAAPSTKRSSRFDASSASAKPGPPQEPVSASSAAAPSTKRSSRFDVSSASAKPGPPQEPVSATVAAAPSTKRSSRFDASSASAKPGPPPETVSASSAAAPSTKRSSRFDASSASAKPGPPQEPVPASSAAAPSTKRSSRFDVSSASAKPGPPQEPVPASSAAAAPSTKKSPRMVAKPMDGADIITAAKRKRGAGTVVVNNAAFEATSSARMQIEPALSLTQGDNVDEDEDEDDANDEPDSKKTRISDITSAVSHRSSNVTPRLCFTRLTEEEENEVQAMSTSLGYVHDDDVGEKTILVTPAVLTTPRHIAAIVIGQGMVVPQWIRESVKAGRWLPTDGYEPVCSVESLVAKNVKIKVQASLQHRSLLNGKGLLDGKSIYIISGTVPDDTLAIMAKDAGATILSSPPSIASAKRDSAADTLWILASSHLHGPLLKLLNKGGKLSAKPAKGEGVRIDEGAKEAFKFLKAGVKVLDRLIIPASCLAMKVAPGNANAFDLVID